MDQPQPGGSNMNAPPDETDENSPGPSSDSKKFITFTILHINNNGEITNKLIRLSDYVNENDIEMPKGTRLVLLKKYLDVIIADCESRIKSYLKSQRSKRNEVDEYDLFSLYKASSNISSNVSSSESSDDEQAFSPEVNLQLRMMKEMETYGPWLLLSSVEGGWSFENVKNFLQIQYDLNCYRHKAKSEIIRFQGPFKAITKFQSCEELTRVVVDLLNRHMSDKFQFLVFDKMSAIGGNDNPESSDDDLI